MDLNWVVLFREIEIRNRRIRRGPLADPLADPLDRPEWRGFLWAVPAIVRLVARRGGETKVPRCDDSRIGKNLSFRSSVATRGAGIQD
ncbi:hypothetical protein ELH53_06275 [Rhizobium ruizarguesonis]|uniref:hypothetical protein n=1 Tax=Rhizobium ruizarguesonis TaxID=2081791 RepID=UPI000372EAF2|nr:hypothetical protein [Rhizobium ruizarguesonis]MBY5832697.1 hypothetical protein [Rhizobium leguminosarum]NKJ74246.1 hypothetical protein [Rhizobium leguminosarum bv. viciae]QJS26887.1 hypothetical protein RLTA1_06075 [Rhizobium leguminosarum bv. trifolii TA1]MBY5861390.1 hypothetical protein [Rhizobium leguminosarum]MBY5872642.1 hypothetical protein [Rhizobium leguminosarum]